MTSLIDGNINDLINNIPEEEQPDGGFDTIPTVERDLEGGGREIQGGPTADALQGSGESDLVATGAGDDLVAAGDGDDDVLLGTGDDTVLAGTGVDTISGNQGNDSVAGGAGDDLLYGGKGDDSVEGGEGADFVFGDRGSDLVQGGAGDDVALGGRDSDTVTGDEGNDTLDGGKGDDSLSGGVGDDFLFGGKGSDTLTGGTGADKFVFYYNEDGSYGLDSLTDFNRDQGDKIGIVVNNPGGGNFEALTGARPGNSLSGEQFAVVENFSPNENGNNSAAIIYDPDTGLVYYNPDGSAVAGNETQIARVDNTVFDSNNPLQGTDFEIF